MHDEIGAANKRHWERMVDEGCGFTRPWLDLDRSVLSQVVAGRLKPVPSPTNPATEFVDWNSWDGQGYRLPMPYSERVERDGTEGSIQFRHYLAEIFNGLIAAGFSIQQVEDSPEYFALENAQAEPGTWDHWLTYVGEFAIVARKGPLLS